MPITCCFEMDLKVIIFTHIGAVSDDEFYRSYRSFYNDHRFDQSYNHLIDLTDADSSVRSSEAIVSFARFVRKKRQRINIQNKVALIAPSDISFGLARMYESFRFVDPSRILVSRQSEVALAWLGLPENLLEGLKPAIS